MKYEAASVEGTVRWNGSVLLAITLERENRKGEWVGDTHHIELDVDQLACVRRTLRNLAEESLQRQEGLIRQMEENLADS